MIGEECKCYEEYDLKTFNETTVYQKVSGDTVLENLAFDKTNLLRNASKILKFNQGQFPREKGQPVK